MNDPLALAPIDLPPDRADRLRRLARAELGRARSRSWVDRVEPAVCAALAAGHLVWAVLVTVGAST